MHQEGKPEKEEKCEKYPVAHWILCEHCHKHMAIHNCHTHHELTCFKCGDFCGTDINRKMLKVKSPKLAKV